MSIPRTRKTIANEAATASTEHEDDSMDHQDQRHRDLKAHVYPDKAGRWRWRITSGNGRTIAISPMGYVRKEDCKETLDLVLSLDLKNLP